MMSQYLASRFATNPGVVIRGGWVATRLRPSARGTSLDSIHRCHSLYTALPPISPGVWLPEVRWSRAVAHSRLLAPTSTCAVGELDELSSEGGQGIISHPKVAPPPCCLRGAVYNRLPSPDDAPVSAPRSHVVLAHSYTYLYIYSCSLIPILTYTFAAAQRSPFGFQHFEFFGSTCSRGGAGLGPSFREGVDFFFLPSRP